MSDLDRSSLLVWWPKTNDIAIPVPKTAIVPLSNKDGRAFLDGKPLPSNFILTLREYARAIEYPLFLRTDQASAKHGWKDASYVPDEKALPSHLGQVLEFNELAHIMGLPYEAVVLREYIPLESSFEAFYGRLPIAKERRYFVRDGEVICHHPYWIEDAIEGHSPSKENWKELLSELNREHLVEVALLSAYAKGVSRAIEGYWSVDFACSRTGEWYLIDMAEGHLSWHPDCDKIEREAEGT